jgi:hypothetical protein
VALRWTASEDPEGGPVTYRVFRCLATGNYGSPLTAETLATTNLYTAVENSTPYGYLVREIVRMGI